MLGKGGLSSRILQGNVLGSLWIGATASARVAILELFWGAVGCGCGAYFKKSAQPHSLASGNTFGILKKHWRILNNGLKYRDMKVCKKIFVVCCCLHNFLLEQREIGSPKVGRSRPIGDDGILLVGYTEQPGTVTETGISQHPSVFPPSWWKNTPQG